MSIDAAARVNAIIDTVQNIAREKVTDAGGYAQLAIRATDTIHYDEGSGHIIPPTPGTLIGVPTAPQMSGAGASAISGSDIIPNLRLALIEFFQTYFPNSAAEHQQAVFNLTSLANKASAAIDQLALRIGRDAEAVQYMRHRFDAMQPVEDRLQTSIAAGYAATNYLGGRYANANAASAYLLTKFAAGDAATTELLAMLTSGGTAIPATVEAQLWQRDRSRILADAMRATEDSIDSFASRGFSLIPGAAVGAQIAIMRTAQEKIAESSRERAIKNADIIIENIRIAAQAALTDAATAGRTFIDDGAGAARITIEDAQAATRLKLEDAQVAARLLIEDARDSIRTIVDAGARAIESVVHLQNEAIQTAVEYIKALTIGPQLEVEIEKARADIAARFAQVNVQYYSAQVGAIDAVNRSIVALEGYATNIAIAEADNKVRLHTAKGSTDIGIANAKANAAGAAAQSVGNQAAAALSSLNAIASLSQNS